MRLAHTAIALIMVGSMTACGGSDKSEAKPTTSATPTPARYDPCELLSQPERDKAAGKVADFQGGADFYFPEWNCTFGDAPVATSTASVSYAAMRASVWAAKVPYIIDTTPSEVDAHSYLDDTLKRAKVSKADLATMDDASACKVWVAFVEAGGWTLAENVWTLSENNDGARYAESSTCVDGVYADVHIVADNADSKAGRDRARAALARVHQNAVAKLPKG